MANIKREETNEEIKYHFFYFLRGSYLKYILY